MKIAILVPVCSRNQRYTCLQDTDLYKNLLPSFEQTNESQFEYTFFIGYDDDDEFYKANKNKFPPSFKCFELYNCQQSPPAAWNQLAKHAYNDSVLYDYFFQVGDDIILQGTNWTSLFISKLKQHNNIGVVGPCYIQNYLGRTLNGNPPVIENAFVHRTHLDIFGYFFPASFKNWHCDDWISRVYDSFFSEIQLSIPCVNGVLGNRYQIVDGASILKKELEQGIEKIKNYRPKHVFSYCVYGSNPKYCEGMIRNLEQIQEQFPEFQTWIYLGNDVPKSYIDRYSKFSNVKLIETNTTGGRLMTYRLFPIDDSNVNILFTRDADSRFSNRDIWCMNDFMSSPYRIFTIRDHPWHGEPLMLGLSGFRKIIGLNIQESYAKFIEGKNDIDYYQVDQQFAKQTVYFPYQSLCITYTSYMRYPHETVKEIDIRRENDTDFCGNVLLFNECGCEYPSFSLTGPIPYTNCTCSHETVSQNPESVPAAKESS